MQIQPIPLREIRPSATNPRKHFDPVKLQELAEDLREHGLTHAILLRPQPLHLLGANGVRFEIVSGERRFRAASLAGLDTVPCEVRDLDDRRALEIQMTENLQREDITELEEADGYGQMLALKEENGAEVYTVERLAAKIGKSARYVYERLSLRGLPPEARLALDAGTIGPKLAQIIARIPGGDLRAKAAQQILTPDYRGDIMSTRQASAMIQQHFMRELKGAPFDQEDASLNPEIGACGPCPFRTGNAKETYGDVQRGDICTNPACYALKTEVTWQRAQAAATEAGQRVLTEEESKKVFDYGADLTWNTHFVKLADQPRADMVKGEHAKKLPSWKKLLSGPSAPEIVVARDRHGRPHQLVDVRLAIEAAKQNGHKALFKGGTEKTAGDRHKEEQAREREKQRFASAVKAEWMGELANRVNAEAMHDQEDAFGPDFWRACLPALLDHAGSDGCRFVLKRRKLEYETRISTYTALERAAATMPDGALPGLAVELLLAKSLVWAHTDGLTEKTRPLLELFEVDTEAATARVKEAEAKRKAKKQPAVAEVPPPEEQPPAAEPVTKPTAAVPKTKLKKAPGELGKNILALLEDAGAGGLTLKELSEKAGVKAVALYEWFQSKGAKNNERLRKLGPAKYQLLPAAAPEVAAA